MKKSFKNRILLSVGTVVFLLLICELSIRTIDALKGYNFFSNEHRDKLILKDNSIVPYTIFGPKFYVNKNGTQWISSTHQELYPLKKPENTFRIVCFGGSTTENPFAYKQYKIHYPIILQDMLQKSYPNTKIEVINVGYSSFSTSHLLIILALDVISWSPDLIIISENTNDMNASYWVNFTYDYSNKYGLKYYRVPQYGEQFTTMNALFRWSSFYWFITSKFDRLAHSNKSSDESIHLKHISFGNTPPQISQYIFRRNLINFYYIANKWGIPVLFASQPLKADLELTDFMAYKGDPKILLAASPQEKTSHHKFFNKIIKQTAEQTDSYFLDNDSLLAGNPKYFIDAVHYTKEGIEKLAKNYHDYIVSQNLIKSNEVKNVKNLNSF